MRILVTGGAGFIGSHLCEKLISQGHEVIVVDDLSTGRLCNLDSIISHPRFSISIDSVLNVRLMTEIIAQCDMIYHLAAAVGVQYIMNNRLKTLQVDVRGTDIVLDLASREGKKVMLASTSEIYGKNGSIPYKEDTDRVLGSTLFHRWSYSCSKALDEYLAFAYGYERGLPVVIMRLFNTVGPRQVGQYGMVVPRFIESALKNEPLTVYGDGTQTRCFTYVDDVVKAMIALAECERAVGEVFNVGSDEEISIRRLAEKVIEHSGSRSTIQFIPYNEAYGNGFEDMKRRVPDISKIAHFVGWKPSVGIDEILERMIDHMRNELRGSDKNEPKDRN